MKLRYVIVLLILVAAIAYNLGYYRYERLLNEYLEMPVSYSHSASSVRL
jgi:hypothetical protein